MLYSGADPESYITEYILVYEDKSLCTSLCGQAPGLEQRHTSTVWGRAGRRARNLLSLSTGAGDCKLKAFREGSK